MLYGTVRYGRYCWDQRVGGASKYLAPRQLFCGCYERNETCSFRACALPILRVCALLRCCCAGCSCLYFRSAHTFCVAPHSHVLKIDSSQRIVESPTHSRIAPETILSLPTSLFHRPHTSNTASQRVITPETYSPRCCIDVYLSHRCAYMHAQATQWAQG